MNIICKNIIKTYDKKIILDLDNLTIQSNMILGVVGSNGSGKTTLLNIIAGLLQKDSGTILYDNMPLSKDVYKKITLVFQTPQLLNTTVLNNVAYPLKLRGYKKNDYIDLAKKSLDDFNLLKLANQNAKTLSGGEKQKVALIRALIFKPKVLLLDEPTTNIDRASVQDIETQILKANKEGTTIIIVTHSNSQAKRLCTHTLLMSDGKKIGFDLIYKF